jgi:hypothetical protein
MQSQSTSRRVKKVDETRARPWIWRGGGDVQRDLETQSLPTLSDKR